MINGAVAMKFSKSTELAIHGLWMLAHRRPKLLLISEMAEAQGASQSYLAKVFQKMARRGLVSSTRGKRGGFTLARRPESITIADVVRAIEAEEPIYDCLRASRNCQGNSDCLLRGKFREVERVMFGVLEKTSLADLLSGPDEPKRARWLRK